MAELQDILQQVASGALSVQGAEQALRMAPFSDLGFAKVDGHRKLRQGVAEVIYGEGKTPQQILTIGETLLSQDQSPVLITRMSPEAAAHVSQTQPLVYDPSCKIGRIGPLPAPSGLGHIVVLTAGTSDIPVAEEAAQTAECLGNSVTRLYDVGVAGLHRLLAHMDTLLSATAIVAIAGMEGAIASVVGGLVNCPVIAVPTSVGYGASFGGVAALLAMLNSCASGVSVVNIDNGFGAGYLAHMINHPGGHHG